MLMRLAGLLEVLVVAANLPLSWLLGFGREHARLSPIVRQIHQVHQAAVMALVALMAALSILFPGHLAGECALGRCLSGALAVFWAARLGVQRWYYDPEILRRWRAVDVFFSLVFAFLAGVYAAAAAGVLP